MRAALSVFDPVAYLNEPRWRNVRLGLERMEQLMAELGNPQEQVRCIHVAGTNGKGSICCYLSSVLRCAGLKVGMFTSPYIERFEERIQINGTTIPLEELRRVTLVVKQAAERVQESSGEHPTEFELMCAAALVYFRETECDLSVIEVGLGGRLDATNVVEPDLCVIGRIGFDHTDMLGESLQEIAGEKAGIIKEGVPVVTYPQRHAAQEVIEDCAEQMHCPLVVVNLADIQQSKLNEHQDHRTFMFGGQTFSTKMLGSYQPMNAAVAITAAQVLREEGWPLSDEAICRGVSQAKWPGRFEVLRSHPLVIVDGAHNVDGALALRESLCAFERQSGSKIIFVMGVLADKDYPAMVEAIADLADLLVVYTPDNPRALDAAELAATISALDPSLPVLGAASAAQAIREALDKAAPDDLICAFGTLYALSEIKHQLLM